MRRPQPAEGGAVTITTATRQGVREHNADATAVYRLSGTPVVSANTQ